MSEPWRDPDPPEVEAIRKFVVAVDALHDEVARLREYVAGLTGAIKGLERLGRERMEADYGES